MLQDEEKSNVQGHEAGDNQYSSVEELHQVLFSPINNTWCWFVLLLLFDTNESPPLSRKN